MTETEAGAITERILEQFEKAWSFDSRDLERPSADEVLRALIREGASS